MPGMRRAVDEYAVGDACAMEGMEEVFEGQAH